MRQEVLTIPFFSIQLKHAVNTCSNIDKPLLNPTGILIQPRKQTVIYINLQVDTENEVSGTVSPSRDLEDNDDLIICPPLTTI